MNINFLHSPSDTTLRSVVEQSCKRLRCMVLLCKERDDRYEKIRVEVNYSTADLI